MAGKGLPVCIILYALCVISVFVPPFYFAQKWALEAIDKQFFTFSYLNQIPRDWKRSPFESITVTNETYCRKDHPELVFSRPWYGNDLGCDCLGIGKNTGYELEGNENKVRQGGTCTGNQTAAGCRQVEPNSAIIMGQFQGKRVCGRPSNFNFLNATRPNLNGECPAGYGRCSQSAEPDNVICIEQRSDRSLYELCPIVDLKVRPKNDPELNALAGWESVELTEELSIFYTKVGNNLPLTTFSVDVGTPCMDSDAQQSSHLYAIELNRYEECPVELVTNRIDDPRYRTNPSMTSSDTFELSEWDVLTENGVAQVLQDLPSYTRSIGGAGSLKNANKLQFNTRPTIPWKLECELVDGYDREYGRQQFSISLDQELEIKETLKYNAVIAYSLIGFFTFGTCCCGGIAAVCDKGAEGGIVPGFLSSCTRVSVIVMSSIMLSNMNTIKKVSDSNLDILESSEAVDCSDEISRVDFTEARQLQEESLSLLTKGIIMMVFLLVYIGCECCTIFSVFGTRARCTRQMFNQELVSDSIEEFKAFLKYYIIFN